MDLEAAANAFLVRLKELTGAVEEARKDRADLEQELSRAGAEVEADSEAAREKARSPTERARE